MKTYIWFTDIVDKNLDRVRLGEVGECRVQTGRAAEFYALEGNFVQFGKLIQAAGAGWVGWMRGA